MGNVWQKFWIWTKLGLFALLVLYTFIFIMNNRQEVTFWFFPYKEAKTSVFLLTFFAFVAGIVAFFLVRTTVTTLRQVRDVRRRAQSERLDREMADMRSKASMLRAKPIPDSPGDTRG